MRRPGQERGKNSIDCHIAIAHQLLEGVTSYRGGSNEEYEYHQKKVYFFQCYKNIPQTNEEHRGF